MQLEEAYAVGITKLVEYVGSKEDPLTQTVRTHQHNINLSLLQTARRLKMAVQRGTKQIQWGLGLRT
jgi:hypothetical protein